MSRTGPASTAGLRASRPDPDDLHARMDGAAFTDGLLAASLGAPSPFSAPASLVRRALDQALATVPRSVVATVRPVAESAPLRFEARDSRRFKLVATVTARDARSLLFDVAFRSSAFSFRVEPHGRSYRGVVTSIDADADTAVEAIAIVSANWGALRGAAQDPRRDINPTTVDGPESGRFDSVPDV